MRSWYSGGDNADDFLEEIGSLIPTDKILKDNITWDVPSSLNASLTHCAKIAQGVLTADKIVDTPLWAPPTAQKKRFKFFTPSNMLGKEHYRLNVEKSSEYQPKLPELASSVGLKAKVSQYRTCFRLKSLWGGWPSMYPSLIRWWHRSWKYIPEEARDKVV